MPTRTAGEQAPVTPDPPGHPGGGTRAAERGPAAALGLAAALGGIVVATLLAVARTGAAAAGRGEADLAALVGAARFPDAGVTAAVLPDLLGARQLAALVAVLPAAAGVLDGARVAALVCGALAALLVWPVLRAFEAGPAVAVAGVALAGMVPPALALHGVVSTGAPAAVWLGLAAVLAERRPVAAALAALVATVTAPVAGVAVLAFVAHLVLVGTVRVPGRARVPVGAGAAVGAAVLAALAAGPWAGRGAVLPPVVLTAGAVVGAAVLVVAALRLVWLRPVLTPAAVLTAAALLPGPTGTAAAVLALPAVATVAALLLADLRRAGAVAAATVAVTAAAVAVAAVGVPARPSGPGAVGRWVATELPAEVALRADPLDRVELLAAGVAAPRLSGTGAVELVTTRAGDGPRGCASEMAAGPGTGGGRSAVCSSTGAGPDAADERERLGGQLAGNPALVLAPDAAQLLRRGAVDRRVVVVLAALAPTRGVRVDAFPEVPLDAPGAPRRQVLVGGLDGADGPESRRLLQSWLGGQLPPFAPARTEAVPGGLLVTWTAPA